MANERDELDKAKDEILNGMREMEKEVAAGFNHAKMLLDNTEEAMLLKLEIGDYKSRMVLINVEVIAMFEDFINQVVAYYKDCVN